MSITNKYKYNMYNKYVKFLGLPLFFLSACSTASESFDSEATLGVGSKSISQVNKMLDRGEIKSVTTDDTKTNIAPVVSLAPLTQANPEKIVLSDDAVIYRQPEQVLRVWIAPFQDQSGNFYEASVVHTLLRPSFWQMNNNPFKA